MEALRGELVRLLSVDPARNPSLDPLGRDFSSDWAGERLALQEIYGTDFEPFHGRSNVFRIQVINGEACAKRQLWLYFVIPAEYPARPCIVEVEPNLLLSRKQTDMMYALLADETTRHTGVPMVFDLCSVAATLLDTLKGGGDDAALLLLAARGVGDDAEFCSMFVDADIWPEEQEPDCRSCPSSSTSSTVLQPMRLFTATQFTGPVAGFLSRMPPDREVLHVEPVMRHDLAVRFDRQQLAMYQKYSSGTGGSREDANREELSAISVAFHGTRLQNVHSIVREGLVVPREETGVAVASGSTYGRGIYLSPRADLSIGYCQGNKLLVCAVLLGRQMVCTGRSFREGLTECAPGYDSHVSPCGNEWIVFNEAQVLPCFVIHYRSKTLLEEEEGYVKQRRTEKALKLLPFGFGPDGDRFEVLEVAPVDDDDEAYLCRDTMRGGMDEFQPNVAEERRLKGLVG